MPAISIDTPRLVMRRLTIWDTEDLLEYHSDPQVIKYIPWTQRSRTDVEQALTHYETASDQFEKEGDFWVLGWALKTTGKVVGQSNASLISKANRTADIGWVTNRQFWRQGLALEASSYLLKKLFQHTNLHRVVANIDARNPESAALAVKLGMRREAQFRQSVFTKGEWCDMWQYAILRDDALK